MPRASGMTPRLHANLLASRATLLGVLLAVILVLGGLLASEAWNAARSGAATARRALEIHAAVAAWEFLRGVEAELSDGPGDALAPVIAARASTPFDSLPGPQVLAASFSRSLSCPTGEVSRRLVRVDLRDGSLAIHGPSLREEERQWIIDTLTIDAAAFPPGRRDAIILGEGEFEHLALVYGVKFAGFGAPIAAYALITCPRAFGAPVFERVMARRPLLPDAVLARLPNDSVVALTVRDRYGHTIWKSVGVGSDMTSHDASATLARLGGLTAHAALRSPVVDRLAAEPVPRTRLGILVALLSMTTVLAVVAFVQLRREQELARLRADFTSSISHELRTPLAQIMLFGETLALDRYRTGDERRLAAGTIVQEAQRLMHMVDNVLHYARTERGVASVAPHPEPLSPLARSVVRGFTPLAEGVRFEERLGEDVVAMADAAAVRQVLINLLDNAVKYGPPGQRVTVGVDATDGRARLWVEDEGTGVPPEERDRVFEPYVRLTRHQGGSHGGSGIGLSVVRELAELHGGTARVEAAAGGGARFVVELPLAGVPPRAQHARPSRPVHHPDAAARIMDVPDVRDDAPRDARDPGRPAPPSGAPA